MAAEFQSPRRWSAYDLALVVAALAFAAPLLAYAVIGSNMRYSGDDYCYAGIFRQQGLLGMLRNTYFGPSPFHGNRVSLTLTSGVADTIGPVANALLPSLALVLWVIGFVFLLRSAALIATIRFRFLEPVVAAEGVLVVTLAMAPQLVQSLYWRSGMLPYFAPVVVYPYIAGIMVRQFQRDKASRISLAGIFVLSLLAGGFSETAAAVQFTLLLIAGVAVIVLARNRPIERSTGLTVIGTSLAGTLLAIAILALSPSNQSRLEGLDRADSLLELLRMSGYHTYLLTHGLAVRQYLPILALLILFFWLSAAVTRRMDRSWILTPRRAAIAAGVTGLLTLAVVLACMLPSAFIQSSYPVGRALVLATFAVALGVAVAGSIAGSLVASRTNEGTLRATSVAAVLISLYPLVITFGTLDELPRYQRWARFWDDRHELIVAERLAGKGELEVVELDHIIPEVAELSPDPDHWYNNCAEWYYDIQVLAANQPGWDE
ncbi:MAG: DUF6056 family protein [Anaerolineales bacterium]